MKMKKKLLDILVPAVPAAIILGTMMFSHSCANTTTPPSGGPKDTIPPVITELYPFPGSTGIPVEKIQLKLTFNEYVTVKDAKSLYLSPPMEKAPKYKIKGKSVVVYFEEPLDSNRTYTLDVTNAIADNNEGNMFPGYTLVFSTGSVLDSCFLARQCMVSAMSYLRSSGSESFTTVTGMTRESIKAIFSVSGSYLLLLFSSHNAYILYTVSCMFLIQKKPQSSVLTAASGLLRKTAESA